MRDSLSLTNGVLVLPAHARACVAIALNTTLRFQLARTYLLADVTPPLQ